MSGWKGELLFTSRNMRISCEYGPVKFLDEVPFPENPRKLMKSRFRLFFETFST